MFKLVPAIWVTLLINEHHIDAKTIFVKCNQLNFVDLMPAWRHTQHRQLLTLEK